LESVMKHTVKVIEAVESEYANLGLPVVFSKLIDIAGLGCFLVGDRGVGKNVALEYASSLSHRFVLTLSRITPAGLERLSGVLSGSSVLIVNPDFSSLSTAYLKDALLMIVSSLISDGCFAQSITKTCRVRISNADTAFLSAVQPRVVNHIFASERWEGMYRDRLLRFYMLYLFGAPDVKDSRPSGLKWEHPGFSLKEVDAGRPRRAEEYGKLLAALMMQTSENRSRIYADRLVKASALFNHRREAEDEDYDFISIFSFMLGAESVLSEKTVLTDVGRFDHEAFSLFFRILEYGGADVRELSAFFGAPPAKIRECLKRLASKKLVQGEWGGRRYMVHEKFLREVAEPICVWLEAHGLGWVAERERKTLEEALPCQMRLDGF